jgi:large subunit ribosomal protein L15e
MYRQISKEWRSLVKSSASVFKQRAISWRRGDTIVRIKRPTRLDRAKALGYKAKQGIVVVRIKISRGGMRQKRPTSGRRPKHMGTVKIKGHFSSQDTAERRVLEKYPNAMLLGSYPVYQDGRFIWHEVILADLHHPSLQASYEIRKRFPEILEQRKALS